MSSPSAPIPPDPSEVERLRTKVAHLEAELDQRSQGAAGAGTVGPDPVAARSRGGFWRTAVVAVCVALLAVLAPLTIVATWAHDEVSDTDRYVATVAPLAEDPAVQAVVSQRITDEIVVRLDVRAVTQQAVDALAQRGLPPRVTASLQALSTPLASGVESFIRTQVDRVVGSEQFANAWEQVNRQAHEQMVAVLTGETGDAVAVVGDSVQLNLGPVVQEVKERLLDAGFTLATRIPQVSTELTLFQSADLAKAQTGFRLLEAIARALPVVFLVILGVAILASHRRRRTLMVASLVVAASMLLLGLLLNAFRVVYLDAIPADRLPADAAGAVYDNLVWFIRLGLRALLVLALVVALVAWVTGREPAPTALRRGANGLLERVRRGSDRAGLDTGPVGRFLGTYRTAIRGLVAGAVVLIYVLADHPTGAWTLTIVVVAGLILLLVELLARKPDAEERPRAAARAP